MLCDDHNNADLSTRKPQADATYGINGLKNNNTLDGN
jgi:hypothetical protein